MKHSRKMKWCAVLCVCILPAALLLSGCAVIPPAEEASQETATTTATATEATTATTTTETTTISPTYKPTWTVTTFKTATTTKFVRCPTCGGNSVYCRCTTAPPALTYNAVSVERKTSSDGLIYDIYEQTLRWKNNREEVRRHVEVVGGDEKAERIVIPAQFDGVAVKKVILDGAYTAKEIVVEGGTTVYITSWKMPNLTDVWAVGSRCYLFCAEIYGEDGETERAALSRPTVHMRKDRKYYAELCLGEGPTVNYEANAAESTVDIGYYAGNFDETILTSDSNTQELLEWEAGRQTRDFERLGLPYEGQKCYSDQAIVIRAWQYVIDEEGDIAWELPQHARYNCEISFE